MLLPVLLAFAFFASASPPAPDVSEPLAHVWIGGNELVGPDGSVGGLPGWRVRLGLDSRAHLVGPAPRAPQPTGQWDDVVRIGAVRLAVRTVSRDADTVYVTGRLSQADTHRSFLLRWDTTTGSWAEAAHSP